jgi:ATP-binding cassette subfamily F protein uup
MTFKDRHALETLPARIASLEAETAKLTKVLDDPDLYTRNPTRFTDTTAALQAARRALAEAEERWLELEMRREALEG